MVRAPALAALSILAAIVASPAVSQSGQAMAEACFVCHGPSGRNDGGSIASLAGQPRDVVAQQMTDFKADRRAGTIMNRIAKSYSDEQIQRIAEYLATLR